MSRAKNISKKNSLRAIRKKRVRGSIGRGTAETPRVTIFRSNRYLTVQAVNDIEGVTLAAANSKALGLNANKQSAVKVAATFAEALKSAGIEKVVFDRNGYLYHGVVAAFADGLRENGIKL